jgi:hypothetical protein
MKRNPNYWLVAALIGGLSMSVASCKDDDDDSTSEQRNEDADPMDTDEAMVAWRWLSLLTDAETLESSWASKTYTPNIGVASENNQNTRIVTVADLDEAKGKFADLAGVETSLLANDYTATQSGVGSLQWSPSPAGADNLAEVTVNIRTIPSLQKIIYCTTDQVGKNGWGLSGQVDKTAYYRFGDVICDRDKKQYWVCVRPAFAPGDNGESHWICIFNRPADNDLPEANIYTKYNKADKYGNRTIKLPTKLSSSREHMNNLANLVYALLDPGAYATKVGTDPNLHNNGLGGFDYQYHGQRFLTNVARFWDNTTITTGLNIWQLLFNRTHEQMADMTNMILLYNGYQWRVGQTGYVWEYKAPKANGFQRTAPGSEKGDMVLYNFGGEGFDVTRYISSTGADGMAGGPKQFDDNGNYRWVVVHAKGSELQKSGKYSPNEQINGFNDVYRYNEKMGTQVHDALETETSLEQQGGHAQAAPEVGNIIGADGNFYATKAQTEIQGGGALAIVMALSTKDKPLENGTQYNGLAMALFEPGNCFTDKMSEEEYDCGLNPHPTYDYKEYLAELNGLAVTNQMADGCGKGHVHPAAGQARNYKKVFTVEGRQRHNFSPWFIPSFGQFLRAFEGLGFVIPIGEIPSNETVNGYINGAVEIFKAAGMNWKEGNVVCMSTCSLHPSSEANNVFFVQGHWYANFRKLENFSFGGVTTHPVCPFILFEY